MKKTKTILITSFALLFFGVITTFATWPTVPQGSVIGGWLGEVFDISNSNSTKLIVESANVGIGTTSPTQKLEVNGNIKASGRHLYLGENLLYSDNSSALTSRSNHDTATQITLQDAQSTNYGRVYGDGDGQNFGLLDGDTHWSYLAAKNLYTQFLINNSAKMTILNNGNVGIGTDNPIQKLEVNGTGRFAGNLTSNGEIISTNPNAYRMVQGNYGTFFRNDGADFWLLSTNSGDQYGSWNNLRPFAVNLSSGNVQIGTSLSVGGKIKMDSQTTASDSDNTVATKSYVDNKTNTEIEITNDLCIAITGHGCGYDVDNEGGISDYKEGVCQASVHSCTTCTLADSSWGTCFIRGTSAIGSGESGYIYNSGGTWYLNTCRGSWGGSFSWGCIK